MAIIGSRLGLLADDHGDTRATATALLASASGAVSATNPQTDAGNLYPENKGVIGQVGDKDVFWVRVSAGALTLRVNPAWDAFYRTAKRGSNLDLRATLTDAQGAVIAQSDPGTDTYATVSATVAAGFYYLEVAAVGSANYSDYASQGQYFVSGQVTPSTAVNQPPVAVFDYACAGLACTFTDRSSDSDGSLVALGNGTSAMGHASRPPGSRPIATPLAAADLQRAPDGHRQQPAPGAGTATAPPRPAAPRRARPTAPANAAPTARFTAVCSPVVRLHLHRHLQGPRRQYPGMGLGLRQRDQVDADEPDLHLCGQG